MRKSYRYSHVRVTNGSFSLCYNLCYGHKLSVLFDFSPDELYKFHNRYHQESETDGNRILSLYYSENVSSRSYK